MNTSQGWKRLHSTHRPAAVVNVVSGHIVRAQSNDVVRVIEIYTTGGDGAVLMNNRTRSSNSRIKQRGKNPCLETIVSFNGLGTCLKSSTRKTALQICVSLEAAIMHGASKDCGGEKEKNNFGGENHAWRTYIISVK